MDKSALKTILIALIILSAVALLCVLLVRGIFISKGSLRMYEKSPVSYINKPIDINITDLNQKYEFKNTVIGKHNIEVKILTESVSSNIFNGEYKISIYDSQNKLVKDFFSATNLNKEWYRIHITTDWTGGIITRYYEFGEVELSKIDSYTIDMQNIKGLSSTGKGKYQIGICPLEYNYAVQKRRFDRNTLIKLSPYIILLIGGIFGLVYLRKTK